MKRDFIRKKRTAVDSFAALKIKIEKRSTNSSNGVIQALINVIVYCIIYLLFFQNNFQLVGIFIAFMVASVVVQVVIKFRRSIVKKKEFPYMKITNDKKLYKEYLAKIDSEINDYINKYEQYLLSTLFPAFQLNKIINKLTSQLFWRLPSHNDFLTINMGETNFCFPVTISYPSFMYNENDAILEQFKTKTEAKIANASNKPLPYGFSLNERKRIAYVNKGTSQLEFNQIINALILDVSTFQSSEEVALCIVFDTVLDLDWTRFLPHVWFGNRRLMYCDSEPETEFTKLIMDAVNAKTKHIVAVIDADFAREYRFYDMFNSESLPEKLSVIFYSQTGTVPTRVEQHVDCFKSGGRFIGQDKDFEIRLNSLSVEESEELAKKLFNIRLIDNLNVCSNTIPERLTLFELFNVKNASNVPIDSLQQNVHIQTRFPVKVGLGNEREEVYIDLTNSGDGNHCLVTGTNGSGKSEFMLTYILAACSAYRPDYLSFIAIDFKGGAMSSKIKNLPHCRGEFTNCDGHISKRELTRIAELLESEISYRERVMIASDCANDLPKYHRNYAAGKVEIALPRLLIVVDEVAVFFQTDNTAVNYITRIATVGRALGMILLVATQSKSGIIPSQVRTNINVNVEFYSEDDIKKGYEKIKGRGVINSLKKIDCSCQVALSSIYESNIAVVDFITTTAKSRMIGSNERNTQFEQVFEEIQRRYPGNKYAELLQQVITEPLELLCKDYHKLSALQEAYYDEEERNSKLAYPIGIADNIYMRRRDPFVFILGAYNLVIYGKPQTGKTTFIKSLLVSLFNKTNGLRPNALNVYIVAKDSTEYSNYCFPHIGSIVPENDLYYFLLFLVNEIMERRNKADGSNYRAIVAIIDDCYESIQQSEEITRMMTFITSESLKYKISVILTTSYKPGFGNMALRNFNSIIALYMGDDFDYSSLMHVDAIKTIPEIQGRCLIDIAGNANRTLETQIANSYNSSENEIKMFAENYCDLWSGKEMPKAIPLMPEKVSLKIDKNSRNIPVGLAKDLSIANWNIINANTYLVSSFAANVASQFVIYLIKVFVSLGFNVLVVDNERENISNAKDIHNVKYFKFNEQEELKAVLNEIVNETHHKCDGVLVMYDYIRFTFPSGREEVELVKIIDELMRNRSHGFCGVFAEQKEFLISQRASLTRLTQYLEGVNSGLLIGGVPNIHTFGFNGLSLVGQSAPLDIGWGVNVSPSSADTKRIKLAMELDNHE